MRHALLVLLSGCSVFGVGRASLGVSGTTEGTFGLSGSLEFGGGWIDTPHQVTADTKRDGEAISMFGGGGVTTKGAEIEAGARAEYVRVGGRRAWRLGMRDGVVARQEANALMFFDATYATEWPLHWGPRGGSYGGIELRAGPSFAIVDDPTSDANRYRWHAMRFYAGVVGDSYAIRRHRYDPLNAIIGDPKGSH